MDSLKDTLTKISDLLNGLQADHAIIGGFALAAHGIVRATLDIDLLVDGNKKGAIKKAVDKAGYRVFFQTDEVMQLTYKGQVDILFANRPKTKEMISTAKIIKNFPVPVVTLEGLIGLKIQAYKNDPTREMQDKADIVSILRTNNLDFDKIKEYADIFNEWKTIEDLKSKL
jgi:ABC-type amino acid transport substrate-binding protein